MCFHGVIKPIANRSIFGSAWRKYGEKMEMTGMSAIQRSHLYVLAKKQKNK